MAEVDVTGLKEFNKALQRASSAVPQAMQPIALNAAIIVVKEAVPTVPRRSGRAASSIQAFVSGQGAQVSGGKGVDYYRWLELGGRSGVNGSNYRPVRKQGRYINPAHERSKPRIQAMVEAELAKVLKDAGLEND